MAEEYSIVYIDHIFFIHSSFDGHRGSFHSLAIVDIAAVNIGMQASTWMELEGITLSEISQSEKDKHYMVSEDHYMDKHYMVSFIWGI